MIYASILVDFESEWECQACPKVSLDWVTCTYVLLKQQTVSDGSVRFGELVQLVPNRQGPKEWLVHEPDITQYYLTEYMICSLQVTIQFSFLQRQIVCFIWPQNIVQSHMYSFCVPWYTFLQYMQPLTCILLITNDHNFSEEKCI